MFAVLLKFSKNADLAAEHMAGHKAWIQSGFDDGAFLLVGSIEKRKGGFILAAGENLDEVEARANDDPFVIHDVVTAEILEISPARMDERLSFLKTEE